MGIYITLTGRQRIPLIDEPYIKLDYCIEAIRFFKDGLFKLENAEIWLDAPSESQGGHLKKRIPTTDLYSSDRVIRGLLKRFSFEAVSRTIIIFNGVWDFDGVELGGYFSVHNNRAWRKVYRDIEIDAYGKGDFEDIVDILWETPDTISLVQKFVKALTRSSRGKPLAIYEVLFSKGVPTDVGVTNLLATYFSGARIQLMRLFYRVLRNSRDVWVVSRATPIDNRFFIKTLDEELIVQKRLTEAIGEALLIEETGRSATYIAKERDSFDKLYASFVNSVLKPALKELPPEEEVKEAIERGLKEFSKGR